jgi:hypothetical protein
MKVHMTRTLRFWVDCAYENLEEQGAVETRNQLIAKILGDFEVAGDAMRYLNAHGQIAWKATPRMLRHLADAEREAKDDLADHQ